MWAVWETAFCGVFQAAVGAFCASTGAAPSTPSSRVVAWRSTLGIAQGRAVDADRVALMAQPTEERVDERFVTEKRLPLGIIQIGRDNRGPPAVAFLHQFEKDVGLFGLEIELAQLVDVQDVDPDERVEEAARDAVDEPLLQRLTRELTEGALPPDRQ